MKKPTAKKLSLSTQTISTLPAEVLAEVGGASGQIGCVIPKTGLTCFCLGTDGSWGRV